MKAPLTSRRNFLGAGATGLVTGIAGATGLAATGLATAPAQAANACGGMTRAQYDDYVTLFNNADPSFTKYYHDDVVLQLGTTEIKTAKGIRDFYAEVRAHIHEKVEATHFVSDATGVAVLLPSEFKVYKDWENGFFQRPLKKGEVLRIVSIGLYWVEGGKFRRILSARQKLVNDWRMEA